MTSVSPPLECKIHGATTPPPERSLGAASSLGLAPRDTGRPGQRPARREPAAQRREKPRPAGPSLARAGTAHQGRAAELPTAYLLLSGRRRTHTATAASSAIPPSAGRLDARAALKVKISATPRLIGRRPRGVTRRPLRPRTLAAGEARFQRLEQRRPRGAEGGCPGGSGDDGRLLEASGGRAAVLVLNEGTEGDPEGACPREMSNQILFYSNAFAKGRFMERTLPSTLGP
nr:uncharacterized protein LOC123284154 [Equus asinus]